MLTKKTPKIHFRCIMLTTPFFQKCVSGNFFREWVLDIFIFVHFEKFLSTFKMFSIPRLQELPNILQMYQKSIHLYNQLVQSW